MKLVNKLNAPHGNWVLLQENWTGWVAPGGFPRANTK